MAYDEELAARVRAVLADVAGLSEKRMFGGLAFLVDRNMAVAVRGGGGLMVRADPARADELLVHSGVDPMVMRGREMAGWLLVDPAAVCDDDELAEWVTVGLDGAALQPPK